MARVGPPETMRSLAKWKNLNYLLVFFSLFEPGAFIRLFILPSSSVSPSFLFHLVHKSSCFFDVFTTDMYLRRELYMLYSSLNVKKKNAEDKKRRNKHKIVAS